jgi:hypothetical protein
MLQAEIVPGFVRCGEGEGSVGIGVVVTIAEDSNRSSIVPVHYKNIKNRLCIFLMPPKLTASILFKLSIYPKVM